MNKITYFRKLAAIEGNLRNCPYCNPEDDWNYASDEQRVHFQKNPENKATQWCVIYCPKCDTYWVPDMENICLWADNLDKPYEDMVNMLIEAYKQWNKYADKAAGIVSYRQERREWGEKHYGFPHRCN